MSMSDVRMLKIIDSLGIPYQKLPLKLIKKNKFNQLLYCAMTDIGNSPYRESNEDYYGVFIHPLDNNLLMSVIADGVGGYADGGIASLYVTERLGMFFRKMSLEEVNNTELFCLKLEEEVCKINANMLKMACHVGVTTLSCAVINKDNIIILSIGDSRVYTYGESLVQVTEDESEVWRDYYQKGLISKDEIRFIRGNNVITNALGDTLYISPEIKVLNKDNMKALLLTTDGVTDILADTVLNQIFLEKFMKSPEMIVPMIIEKAVNGKMETLDEETENKIYDAGGYPKYEIIPGSDNATAVLTLIRD